MSRPADPIRAAVSARHLGAAIGAATGPVAAFGQGWAGTGDGRWYIWLLVTVCGALLGALSYPLFWPRALPAEERDPLHDTSAVPAVVTVAAGPDLFGSGFAALFGFAVGLVAGAFVAFPMGSVMGAFGGALAGALVVFFARYLHPLRGGLALASLGGAGVALFAAWAWLS